MENRLFAKKKHADLIAQAEASQLKRSLGVFELTMLGIGAIIGTGIFVLTGKAAAGTEHALGAGPALTISFVVTGFACALAALCYAEFAAMVPISGSAYTYSYYSFGELMAWIIGWDLILEYAVGNIAVAIGWSGYFHSFLEGFGIHLPGWMSSATGTEMVQLNSGQWITKTAAMASYPDLLPTLKTCTALFNLPALIITAIITILLAIGIKESARVNASLVIVKLLLIGLFLIFGLPHFNPNVHWQNFAPNGWSGIMTGAALVFFAYVGFDAVSTTAEEAKNPQRDLPRGMIYSLLICTVLYILVAAVLTGMVPLNVLGNEKPVVAALENVGEHSIAFIIAMGVTFTMPTVLLVMQLGQIRILYSMSRDGLLGKVFSQVHDRFKTPFKGTIIVGALVAVCAATINIDIAAELTNIGTLFAFVLVAIGVFILRRTSPDTPRKFKVPWYPVVCTACVLICFYLMVALPWPTWIRFFVWMAIGLIFYFLYGQRHSRVQAQG
ncbi:MAG TPA: amino acid permease [Saprospiraceae bacterium]|nr:amino acid permease [Saprospiraceae bacterium]